MMGGIFKKVLLNWCSTVHVRNLLLRNFLKTRDSKHRTGQLRYSYRTAAGQLQDSGRTAAGQLQVRCGTAAGQLQDSSGTATGQQRDSYRTASGQQRSRARCNTSWKCMMGYIDSWPVGTLHRSVSFLRLKIKSFLVTNRPFWCKTKIRKR